MTQPLQEDWRSFRRLVRRARAQLREAQGVRSKLKEAARVARKARKRLLGRLKRAMFKPNAQPLHSRQPALSAQRAAVSALFAQGGVIPSCAPVGGGALAFSVEGAGEVQVLLRDSSSNLHDAQLLDMHPLPSATGQGLMTRLLVQAPPELLDGNNAIADVVLRGREDQVVFGNVPLSGGQASIRVKDFRFENSCVTFSGERRAGSPEPFSLGLYVDGDISASCTLSSESPFFAGTMFLDHAHLDGRAHLLELREIPGLSIIASLYQILPLHITPWNALQTYARPPLDGTLSQQARHHFRSYRLWFDRLRVSGSAGVPPLDELYAELQQGFRRRASYPKIAFTCAARPTVSVVIPVHNRFEVTYYCLCSLLFAFNETSYEVIVVDDGSTDETLKIAEFVDGVDVLRHETPMGFVQSCNDGAAHARGEFIVLLNNDTEVTARWLDELVDVFRNFDGVGLAGSKLVFPDGRLQEAGGVIWGSGHPWNVGRDGNPEDPRYNYLRRVDYVSGAALMIPRALWCDVGGFSAEFAPAYFEDTDLAMKVRARGRFVVYVPASTIYHFEGASAGTNVAAGMKSFQEVNRPKFRRKWAHAYRNHGAEGEALDREKDRDVTFRVLFIDHQFPFVDLDAGSYAAFQEVRLLQSLGAKVTFLPRNLAWMDRHTMALQKIGAECLYAPYVMNFVQYVRDHAENYDLVFVSRYKIAEQVLPLVRTASPRTKVAFNLADLHFLRELREAAAKTPGYSRARAEETRRTELAAVNASDITFSYSDVELEILRQETRPGTKLARMPWVVDSCPRKTPFPATRDILFLGGFVHPPNAEAVKYFAGKVMPLIRRRLPDTIFNVIGSGARSRVPELMSDYVRIIGYVPTLAEYFERTRVFVAPLLAGAGLKGKVLDAISHGVPCVLSPLAAEGTGLTHGTDCLIAETTEAWADCVVRLYTDEELWNQISANASRQAETRYSFAGGVTALERELAQIGVSCRRDRGFAHRFARPGRYGI